jgi:hypothetical protein
MPMRALRNLGWSGLSLAVAAGAAHGQAFSANFEPPTYSGSSTGVLTAGQDGWYIPAVGGDPHSIFTYTGAPFSIPQLAGGGTQFDMGQAVTTSSRAQHDVPGFAAGGVWEAEFDVLGAYNGTLPAADNLGSFSLQDSATTRYFQQLMNWGSGAVVIGVPVGATLTNYTATADRYHMPIGHFTTAVPSGSAAITFDIPSVAWMDLFVNHWYHVKVRWTFDPAAPKILSVSIRDVTAGGAEATTDVSSRDWFLQGGPGSTFPLPTAVRLFAGNLGSVTAWDNVVVRPAPAGCYANCDDSTTAPILNVGDFTCFLQRFAAGDSYANCDNSTTAPVLNVGDFTCFLQRFAAGCP